MQATPTIPAPDTGLGGRIAAALRDVPFGWGVCALLVPAAAVRVAILREFLLENPFASFPILDAELYWQRAGEMAAGHWLTGEPFHIAPLYPYLLGVARWVGGGVLAVTGIQLVLHLATAAMVGAATRFRFGVRAGWVAAALFLSLGEPALFSTRTLGTTLQMFLATLLWWDWARLSESESFALLHVLRVGAWIGLTALAFPAALLLAPIYATWLALGVPERRSRWVRTAAGTGAALAIVSFATVHNALAAGEFIPVTSHFGITLAAGNRPGSIGIFTPLADTSNGVKNQARESALAFEKAHGRVGTWSEIDRFYRARVFRWWLDDPAGAAVLLARKTYWFLTSRHYDNVAAFSLERDYGLQDASRFAPVETPWIMGASLIGIAIALYRPRRFTPELALALLPLVVCVVFMYSARYRALAIPIFCGLSGLAAVGWRLLPWKPIWIALVALLPLPLLITNSLTGFGNVEFMRKGFTDLLIATHIEASHALREDGSRAAAVAHLQRAAAVDPSASAPLRELASLRLETGDALAARAAALGAVRRDPSDVKAHHLLYNSQAVSGDYPSAIITLHVLEKLTPEDGGVQVALAWLYAACPDQGLHDGHRARYHAAAAAKLAGRDEPDALIAAVLAEVVNGDFEAAAAAAERGAAAARARGDDALRTRFEDLAARVRARRAITAPPRLFEGI
ncbi:MAG: hypothetical protein ACE5FL_04570 [Myxococcota bacterium]